jgi:predicted dehydrogenase
MGSIYYYHDWHADKRNTGTLLLQKGSHDIDVVHFVTGHNTVKAAAFGSLDFFGGNNADTLECTQCDKKDSCIDSQVPVLDMDGKPARRFCAFRKEVDVPDNYTCLFELDNGIKVSYNECHFTPDYHRNYTFIGTSGKIENIGDAGACAIHVWTSRGRRSEPDIIYKLKPLEGNHGGADGPIVQNFIDFVRNGAKTSTSPIAARNAVAVGVLGHESMRNGCFPKDIPPLPDDILKYFENNQQK